MARSYGLGSSLGGGGLVGMGQEQQSSAMQLLGKAADAESQRNIFNQQTERQNKATNAQTGASVGATAGMMVYGPVGALVGGLAGGILGGLF